ncbi:unnamed protein product [Protopolystoma xenopodis]|uniref:Uncharacterized protein n=1 Tax=Protopolystoma xenopodis TaxID=117903 RepID=A0A448WES4_9PLAT|nr:unnamed protein product [Protopolystoma xenopodis]
MFIMDRWTLITTLDLPRYSCSALVRRDMLYVLGGLTSFENLEQQRERLRQQQQQQQQQHNHHHHHHLPIHYDHDPQYSFQFQDRNHHHRHRSHRQWIENYASPAEFETGRVGPQYPDTVEARHHRRHLARALPPPSRPRRHHQIQPLSQTQIQYRLLGLSVALDNMTTNSSFPTVAQSAATVSVSNVRTRQAPAGQSSADPTRVRRRWADRHSRRRRQCRRHDIHRHRQHQQHQYYHHNHMQPHHSQALSLGLSRSGERVRADTGTPLGSACRLDILPAESLCPISPSIPPPIQLSKQLGFNCSLIQPRSQHHHRITPHTSVSPPPAFLPTHQCLSVAMSSQSDRPVNYNADSLTAGLEKPTTAIPNASDNDEEDSKNQGGPSLDSSRSVSALHSDQPYPVNCGRRLSLSPTGAAAGSMPEANPPPSFADEASVNGACSYRNLGLALDAHAEVDNR